MKKSIPPSHQNGQRYDLSDGGCHDVCLCSIVCILLQLNAGRKAIKFPVFQNLSQSPRMNSPSVVLDNSVPTQVGECELIYDGVN